MSVVVYTHSDCLRHDPGADHPEHPGRLRAILAGLERAGVPVQHAAPASPEPLSAVHSVEHLNRLERMSREGGGVLFLDTVLNEASWAAVLGGTGAVLAALEHATGRGEHAFAAVRPPGHHATRDRGMGFCLVNNVVVAAREAQRRGRSQVLIIDWDVHHGNGTQALVEGDPAIRYVSLHQHPWYPGTGMADERGVGNIFNVPRRAGLAPELYLKDLWDAIVAATADWRPAVMLISAGFDAMRGDPLGGFTLEPAHYAEWTRRLREHLPEVPIVGMLEGGYDPVRLADGVVAHVRALA
jgi:acetoin utilization deacetylase AcuC-like enzyme